MEDKVTKGGRTRRTTTASATTRATTKAEAAAPAVAKPAATRPAAAPRKAAAPSRTAPAPADAPAMSVVPDRAELVRLAAYFRAERRGFAPGYEVEDWLAAELEVAAKFGAAPAPTPRKTPSRKPPEA